MLERAERKGKLCITKSGIKINWKGNVKRTFKNTSCNQILDSGINYSTVEYLIKQLFSGTQNRIYKHLTAEHQSEK